MLVIYSQSSTFTSRMRKLFSIGKKKKPTLMLMLFPAQFQLKPSYKISFNKFSSTLKSLSVGKQRNFEFEIKYL